MIYFNKFFKIPGPADLGMSDNNYGMPSDMFFFGNDDNRPTWEQYYARVKKEYPVKFFLASTIPSFFHSLWNKVAYPTGRAVYWIKCHTLPSHRFHMLSLRQPKSHYDHYSYGWMDVVEKILYANFNLLREFVEEECPELMGPDEGFLIADGADFYPVDAQWNAARLQLKRLYFWWMKTRQEKIRMLDKMQSEWYEARDNKKLAEELFQKLGKYEEEFKAEQKQNLQLLVNHRDYMWT